jgi:hypothetical protein
MRIQGGNNIHIDVSAGKQPQTRVVGQFEILKASFTNQ